MKAARKTLRPKNKKGLRQPKAARADKRPRVKSPSVSSNDRARRLRELEGIVSKSGAIVFRWRVADGWPVEFVTENVERLLGYTAADFLSGRVSWPGITHPEDVPRLEAEVAGLLKRDITEFCQEYRLFTKAGDVCWIEDRNVVIRNSKGAITHIQGIVFDVSQRKQLEGELLNAASRQRQYLGDILRDTFAQELAGARFLAVSLERELAGTSLPPSNVSREIASSIGNSLHKALTIIRGLSFAGEESGDLAFGFAQLASAVSKLFGVACEYLGETPVPPCTEAVAAQVYHIGEEAVDLAIRRGKARHITIRLLGRAGKVSLVIERDGAPLLDESKNVGARIIRCRADIIGARLSEKRGRKDGTTMTCTFDPNRSIPPTMPASLVPHGGCRRS